MKWICSQIGAREHYAIPRVLHREAKLESFYTDFWTNPIWKSCGNLFGKPELSTRFHQDLADVKVKSFDLTTLVDSVFTDSRKKNSYEWFLYVGSDFGRAVVESLKRKKGVPWDETIFFGYDTGFLEPATWIKRRGGKTVVCQMDPSRAEVSMVESERNLWPGWTHRSVNVPESFFRRREQEWATADIVMVNSEWCKQGLIEQNVPENKIIVVPLAYERDKSVDLNLLAKSTKRHDQGITSKQPVRILFLGQVILRKGIQYLIEAAKKLKNEPIYFDIVGPVGISDEAVKSAPTNMVFHGPVSRSRASEYFTNSDIFVLPTISDGFALAQLEALAHGLPVITTPNCGEVVEHGVDGMIVPAKDSISLAEAIRILSNDQSLRQQMSHAAYDRVKQFSMSHLANNLELISNRLLAS